MWTLQKTFVATTVLLQGLLLEAGAAVAYPEAHEAMKLFRRGVNLGNYLEAPPGQNWGASYSAEDFAIIAREGFDHVRLPIAWHHHSGPEPGFTLSEEVYGKVDFLVTNALARNLSVIINIQHFDEFTARPSAYTNKFFALWRQIAARYAKSPARVAFELINEPKDAATTTLLNPIYEEAITHIRKTNPNRLIFVGPGRWNSIDELQFLKLPAGDKHLAVTVHCYDPFYFTHQGASWTGADTATTGIIFPGPPMAPLAAGPRVTNQNVLGWIRRYNTEGKQTNPSSPAAFRGKLQKAKAWSELTGRPIHVGEFGCYVKADTASRARFYEEFRKALDEHGLPWAMWDWKAGFRYWDSTQNAPAAGMRQAIFGAPRR